MSLHCKEDDILDDNDNDNDKDTHKTKTNIKTETNTKCFKDPSLAIFSKSREFKDIKYDTYRIQP